MNKDGTAASAVFFKKRHLSDKPPDTQRMIKKPHKTLLTNTPHGSVMRLPYSQGGVKFPTGGKPSMASPRALFTDITIGDEDS